jgi:REP element-mobilizing transposase RayT
LHVFVIMPDHLHLLMALPSDMTHVFGQEKSAGAEARVFLDLYGTTKSRALIQSQTF